MSWPHLLLTFLKFQPEETSETTQTTTTSEKHATILQFLCAVAQSYVQSNNNAAYHTSVRLAFGAESLLIDCGAVTIMSSDCIVQRIEQAGKQAGQGSL